MTTTPIARPGVARVVVPVGMLGLGFPAETVARGIALGADAIAVDGGSTDSGPYYLATGTAKTTEEAVTRDLRILVAAGKAAGIPVIVGLVRHQRQRRRCRLGGRTGRADRQGGAAPAAGRPALQRAGP